MEENAKKKKLNIPRLVMLATGVLLALLVGIFALVLEAGKKSLTDQTLVNRWSDGKEFAQISLFISPSQYVTNDEIGLYRHEIESGYKTKGMVAAFEPETGNPNLMDAYMATTTMDLKGEYGSKTLDTFCVGGDFFLFHPVRLLSGNYFSEDDLMHDYILLDEEAAWDLFGGTDVAGKKYFVMVTHAPLNKEQHAAGVFPLVLWIVPTEERKQKMIEGIKGFFGNRYAHIFIVITPEELHRVLRDGAREDELC